MDVALGCTMWMSASKFHLVILVLVSLSVWREDPGWRALAQGSDAGKLFLDQREWEVKWIAGNASANDAICGSLDGCGAACSRVRCIPVSGFGSTCANVDNNKFSHLCSKADVCAKKVKVDYARSFVNLPPPASTTLSSEVARDICLQRPLDVAFKKLSLPEYYSELYFGSASGAFRQFPGREQNETACESFDPRWRPWYVNGISVSKDVKILVDVGNGMGNQVIPDYYGDVGATYLDVAKDLALGLLDTASPGDDIEVFSFDNATATSLGGTFRVNSTYDFRNAFGHSELGPLVTAVKKLSPSPLTGALSNLNGAIFKAASSFNQLKSLKVIVVLSNGLFVVNSTTFPTAELQGNTVKLMVFKLPSNDDGGDTFLLKTSFQKDICSVQGSFESLAAPATKNPLYSLRRYFTYLADVQLSASGRQVSWSNAYASVSQDLKAITPTYPAFGSDGLLIGVAGLDVVIDKLDETLKALVLQDFSRRNRGTLQAPANVSMECFYQIAPPEPVCPDSTPPSSSAICLKNDTSSLADRTCCDECKKPGGLKTWQIVLSAVGAVVIALMLIAIGLIAYCCFWRRPGPPPTRTAIPPYQGTDG